jgi:acetoin utilization deacetylase AcuC-like enzyme
VKAFYCDQFVLPLPPSHRFPMAKYTRLRERVVADGIIAAADLIEPPAAAWEDLLLAHDSGYVRDVAGGTFSVEAQRRIGFPWSPQMVERSRRSVGGTIAAARASLIDGTAANLAGGTHHAFRDRGEGYCVFNDVGVAARVLLRDSAVARVAVVDCDVHQGNGTAAMFHDEPAVFTFSIHGEKNFPFRKEESDLDIALSDGAGDEEYLPALDVALDSVLAHAPGIVFYVSGGDAFEGDRLGRLRLTIAGLARRDALVFARCRRAGVPVIVTMGGGYARDLDAIVTIHANTIREASRWTNDLCRT